MTCSLRYRLGHYLDLRLRGGFCDDRDFRFHCCNFLHRNFSSFRHRNLRLR